MSSCFADVHYILGVALFLVYILTLHLHCVCYLLCRSRSGRMTTITTTIIIIIMAFQDIQGQVVKAVRTNRIYIRLLVFFH